VLERLLHPFEFFAPSYLATVLIAAGCAVLGVFITLRRIVFVGAALAEASAAGVAFAFLLLGRESVAAWVAAGDGREHALVLGSSLAFTLAGVLLFATDFTMNFTQRRLSREALVGIGFAGAGALSILLVAKSAHGLEELKNILAGNVLFVDDAQLKTLAAAFVILGLAHVVFHKEFVLCSFDPAMARTLGIPAGRLDLALYVTLGVAIAAALRTGGVLLVFGFLVLPPAGALLLGSRLSLVFAHAVAQALGGSALGLWLADRLDLPPGPATVATLAVFVVAVAACGRRAVLRRALVAGEVALAALAAGLDVFALVAHLRQAEPTLPHGHHDHAEPAVVAGGPSRPPIPTAALSPDLRALVLALDSDDEGERERAIARLAAKKDPDAPAALVAALAGAPPARRVHIGQALIALGIERGVDVLLDVIADGGAPPFDRYEAVTVLGGLAGSDFDYDPDRDAAGNAASIARFRDWWRHSKGRVKLGRP
jgi:ABC-type Mn2+/Zn2+ transport system permease subunit